MDGTMMDRKLTIFISLLMLTAGSATAAPGTLPLDQVELLSLPAMDHPALLAEDAALAGPGVPLQFARLQSVEVSAATGGTWQTLADGSELWRLRVRSDGAVSLNFGFTRYSIPEGGTLVVLTPDASTVLGPYTERQGRGHGELWTPLVPGDEAVIEVRLPAGMRDELELELTAVYHGYRDIFGFEKSFEKSGACNIDVVCPEGDAWDPQIRSVARIVAGGSLCTGFMVNNTDQDLRPLFMTADHCGLRANNAPSLVVYWNFINSTCRPPGGGSSGGRGDGSLAQTQTGSTFLAGSAISDFTLVQLDEIPPEAYDVHWAGWDARSGDFPGAIAIHHPRGNEKRISFENDATTTTSYLQDAVPGDGTHIRVADWDAGTTEPGSSGSPLFSPEGRVVGQLHGGFAACGNNLDDWYGRISTSWDLGLMSWLDPGATGALFLDGRDAEPGVLSGLVVPGFEVDVEDPAGPTTFFAVRNTTDDQVAVDVKYLSGNRDQASSPMRTDSFMLGPQQTMTQNVRNDLSDLEVADGVASGVIVIEKDSGGSSGLTGDYFRIDSGNDFATGDRLVNSRDLCAQQEIRFVDFGSGSRLRILLDEPLGLEVPSFSYRAYNEAGAMIAQSDYVTSEHLVSIAVDDLVPDQRFGTLLFDFSAAGGGFAAAEYSAFGRFSVELNGVCRSLTAASDPEREEPSELPLKGGKTLPELIPDKACVPENLECNSMVTGTLTPDDCALGDGTVYDEWQFAGTGGDEVTIDFTSEVFDTFLFLVDPTGGVAAVDDDSGEGANSRISFRLDSTGTWSILANNYTAADPLGDYSLSLSCEGDEPPASELIVPGFSVEVADPAGPTTFFAVRNTSDSPVDLDIAYYGEQITATPLRADTFMLGPQQTMTRDVRSNLEDLNVSDGFATGLIVISGTGGGADALEGDYFRIDSGNDFATGDRLVKPAEYCVRQEVRFVDFGSGSRFKILLEEPQGSEMPSFTYTAYSEAGAMITTGGVASSDHLVSVAVDDLVAEQRFGTLVFDFANSASGLVTAEYSAFGRFSVELNGACLAASAP